jgi:NAD(P)-dependent dehydrogenase (short-subunit alcohol dehydrogenase family)
MSAALEHRPVIPAGRAAAPAEIAQAVVALAAAESGYTTGASLLVDGGLLLASGPEALEQAVGLPPADK